MSEVFGFTEPERQRFLEMWKWYKTQSPKRPIPTVELDDYPAPDIYIAKTPTGGIPAISLAAGRPGTDIYDEPGYAKCDIYRIVENQYLYTGTGPGDDELHKMESTQKRVYNLSPTLIPGSAYIPVARTKQGVWVAMGAAIATTGFNGSFTFCTGGTPTTRTAVVVNGLITSIA